MSKNPQILGRAIVARSRLFSIERLRLRFANGAERYFERLISKNDGAVLVIPMLDNQTILLIREYAAGVERYELGFPKGVVDPNEDPIDAANRELKEEIGYGAKDLKIVSTMTTAPGYWGSQAAIILARDLYEERLLGDEPEPLEVVPWRINDFRSLLKRPDFTEARNIAALLLIKEMFT